MLGDSTHRIGQVAAVESERLIVEIDDAASSLVKAGSFGVLPVGAVNSYVTVTAGATRVVAIVTAVRIRPDRITPSAARRVGETPASRELEATMIGRIHDRVFEPGIASYPSLFSPVSVATRADLDALFQPAGEGLRIGTAAVSPDQEILLDTDRLLSRHFAVLGSTGSGKSCTVMAVLDGIAELGVPEANIIIFDANGEYSTAFATDSDRAKSVSSFTIGPSLGSDGLTVPLWFLNNDEHIELLKSADGIQTPILQRSVADARVTGLKDGDDLLTLRIIRRTTQKAIDLDLTDKRPQGKIREQLNGLHAILCDAQARNGPLAERWVALLEALAEANLELNEESWNPLTPVQTQELQRLCLILDTIAREAVSDLGLGNRQATSDFDAPAFYSFEDLADVFLPQRVQIESIADPKIAQFMVSLQLRMTRLLADERYAFMTRVEPFDQALACFLQLLFGKPQNIASPATPWSSAHARASTTDHNGHAVTIIDLSHVGSDLLEIVTALIARLIHELAQRVTPRGSLPILLVLEEAHRYVTRPTGAKRTQSSIAFERIAKEGRKFGVSLCLASQRPSELDPTVLSQCGTVIAHRISNQIDQEIIRSATPLASRDLLRQLPGLATQHAIVLGEATTSPVSVRIRPVPDPPNSHDPEFLLRWRTSSREAAALAISNIASAWEQGNRATQPDTGSERN